MENEQQNQMDPNQRINNQNDLASRISSKDILAISSDSIPSLILVNYIKTKISFITYAFISTQSWCSNNFPLFLKAMLFVFSAFLVKSIIHFFFIYYDSIQGNYQKVSLFSLDLILNL
jgi:hypothetical protein